jgi:two-component system nitrogen regulation response regulator NtrX
VRHQRPGRDERETAEDCGQKRVDESRHALIVLFGRVHGNRTSFARQPFVPIDVRIVAATNRDLASEVAHGRYRADLYARLTESVIQLDPLRDRPEDLEPLWHHFVDQLAHGATLELTGTAFEAMALYPWPLNVRELRQLVRSALLEKPGGGQLGVDDLPSAMRRPRVGPTAPTEPPGWPLLGSGEVPTTQQLRRLVEEFHGNVTDIAAFLGKDRKQIYRWLRREHIDPNAYRSGPGRPQR